jgi:hypothetical protein
MSLKSVVGLLSALENRVKAETFASYFLGRS